MSGWSEGGRLCSAAFVLEEEGASEPGTLELGPPARPPLLRIRARISQHLLLPERLAGCRQAGDELDATQM